MPLPSGAATSAAQTTAQTSLDAINTKLPTLTSGKVPVDGSGVTQPVSGTVGISAGSAVIGHVVVDSLPSVTGTFWQATQPVSAAALPLPTGAATSAAQTTAQTSLSSIDTKTPALASGKVPVDGSGVTQPVSGSVSVSNFPGSQAVTGTFYQATQPVSLTSTPLPTGAALDSSVQQLHTDLIAALPAGANKIGSVDLASLNGAATATNQVTTNSALSTIVTNTAKVVGQTTMAASQPVVLASNQPAIPLGSNTAVDYRDTCNDLSGWNIITQGTNDIFMNDGNCAGVNYNVISRDPLASGLGTDFIIESKSTFKMPFHAVFQIALSQRVWGSDFSTEFVSTDAIGTAYIPVAISSIQQSTTTLTVTTTTAHNLVPGISISVYGVADSRFNYPSLVVATITSTTSFTVTAGPQGTIPSVTAGPFASGYITRRARMGYSQNGSSLIFENTTATQGSVYDVGNSDNCYPSGTITGNNSATTLSTAPVALVTSPYSYAWSPTAQFELLMKPEASLWANHAISSTGSYSIIRKTDQNIADPNKTYKMRIRATVQPSYSTPVAQIVSAVKTASTTATITTDVSHGLTTSDYVVIYGISNQAANAFPNIVTATAVASVINATSFTIVIGTSNTVTSYGGYVARINGGNLMSACGATAIVAQNVVRTSNIVTLTGSATWTGMSIGDYINLVGCRDLVTGATLGVDGPYLVQNLATTTLTLTPIGNCPTGADIGSTACGGGVIKRTDYRLFRTGVTSFTRAVTESKSGWANPDTANALPVNVANTVAITSNSAINLSQVGGSTPNTSVANGSTNKALGTAISTAIAQTDQSATAYAGSGRINGTVVASAMGGGVSCSFDVNLTITTIGTATSMVPVLAESYDSGTTYTDIWTGTPMTATGHQRVPAIPIAGRRRWSFMNVGGTSTTAPATIIAQELPAVYALQRQFVDIYAATNPTASIVNGVTVASTLVSTTLSSTSGVALMEGCKLISISGVFTGGTPTTAPIYTLQVSQDATNWFTTTCTMTPTAAGTFGATLPNACWRYARLIVTTASAGGTAYGVTYTAINGIN